MSARAEEKARRREERLAQEREQATRERTRRLVRLGAIVGLAVVLVVVAIVVSQRGSSEPSPGTADASGLTGVAETTALLRGIPQDGTVLGDPDAPVTLTEFADLQCPACRSYALETLPTLVRDYVRPGRVKMDLRLLRFLGDDSGRLASAALAAGEQDRLWNVLDLVYHNQGEENSGFATDEFLRRIGEAVPGVDPARLVTAASSNAFESRLAGVDREATTARVDSTPSFFVNESGGTLERFEPRSFDPTEFTSALDDALRSAS